MVVHTNCMQIELRRLRLWTPRHLAFKEVAHEVIVMHLRQLEGADPRLLNACFFHRATKQFSSWLANYEITQQCPTLVVRTRPLDLHKD